MTTCRRPEGSAVAAADETYGSLMFLMVAREVISHQGALESGPAWTDD